MTYTPFPVWPAPEGGGGGSGGGADEVYFAFFLLNEDAVPGAFGGATFNSGVSISGIGEGGIEAGVRIVVLPTGGGLYQSFVSDGTTTAPYEVPQLQTFAKSASDFGGQSALLNAYYDLSSGELTPNTTYLMIEDQLIPAAGGGGAAAPEVAEVYVMATVAQVEAGFGATVTGTEITFAEAPPGTFRMLVGNSLTSMTSYTTDGTTVAPVDTEQIIGSAAKFVFAAVDGYASGTINTGEWSVYAINGQPDPDQLLAVGGQAVELIYGSAINESRGVWAANTYTDDHTILWASDLYGDVHTMEAATDKTFTVDETGGGWLSGHVLRFHNIGTGGLTVEPAGGASFTAGSKAVASFSILPGGWATAWRSPNNDGEWIVTGDNEAWLWDGVTDYLPAYGARRFVGPNDPAGEGFTLADGDQWEDTTP